MAAGGISVSLVFQRAPFLTQTRTIWLPWNQFVVVERVTMSRAERRAPACDLRNLVSPYPLVLPSPLTRFSSACEERGPAVPELQVQYTTRTGVSLYLRHGLST